MFKRAKSKPNHPLIIETLELFGPQAERIKEKLKQAKKKDRGLKVFGASFHRYEIGPPIKPHQILEFETKNKLELPSDLKAFLLLVGNGGQSKLKAGCGPFYGIYDLNRKIWKSDFQRFSNPVLLQTKMTDNEWAELCKPLTGESYNEELEDAYEAKLFGGLLAIGHQGCSGYHSIALTGLHKGRVIYIDEELGKPSFCFETNFLDWYERWLDEILAGLLLKENASYFGKTMAGNDRELMSKCFSSSNYDRQVECIEGLSKLLDIDDETEQELLKIAGHQDGDVRIAAIAVLTQFRPLSAERFLLEMVEADKKQRIEACRYLNWYVDTPKAFVEILRPYLQLCEDQEEFDFINYVLGKTSIDYIDDLRFHCLSGPKNIRVSALYFAGNSPSKHDHKDIFLNCLGDEDPVIIHAALQASERVVDKSFLPVFWELQNRFQTDEHYIRSNLKHRLREMGYGSIQEFKSSYSRI